MTILNALFNNIWVAGRFGLLRVVCGAVLISSCTKDDQSNKITIPFEGIVGEYKGRLTECVFETEWICDYSENYSIMVSIPRVNAVKINSISSNKYENVEIFYQSVLVDSGDNIYVFERIVQDTVYNMSFNPITSSLVFSENIKEIEGEVRNTFEGSKR